MKKSTHFKANGKETRRRFVSNGLCALVCTKFNFDSLPDSSKPNLDCSVPDLGESTKMPLSIQEISDRLEIQDVLTRYCYAVDDRDWDAYRQLFTHDAVLDDTVTGGIKSGVEEHIIYMQRALSKVVMSQHAISTILIELNGNEAKVRVHCSCPMVLDTGQSDKHVMFQGLWYRDSLVRTDGGWKIRSLVEEVYWKHNAPVGFKF